MANDLRRAFLPYCLKRLEDGSYVLLNRSYKPLGVFADDWVTYETHPSRFRFVRALTKATAEALCVYGGTQPDGLFLYDDGSIPTESAAGWKAYSARLQRLSSLEVKPAPPPEAG